MKFSSLSIFLFALITLSCENAQDKKGPSVAIVFQTLIDSIYATNPDALGIMAHVICPDQKISWTGAVGLSDKKAQTLIEADQPALIASSIKTYVSATMLRLQEKGLLTIDDAIGNHLTPSTIDLFEEDGYNFDSIQIKHLLSHTSGIEDYANDTYLDLIDGDKMHRWTRDEQLALAVELGDPLGKAGDLFSYADANYLLCTEIMEQKMGQPFYTVMRELLDYEALGLKTTWFPTLEEKPAQAKNVVHQYWGEKDWDSYKIDISVDLYGGGGIATNTEELARFSYSLFNGEIIRDPEVFELIYTDIETRDGKNVDYFLGLSQGESNGLVGYGHGGFWGTTVLYFPDLNASVSVFVLNKDYGPLRADVMNGLTAHLLENKRN